MKAYQAISPQSIHQSLYLLNKSIDSENNNRQ